jgi:CzcA family heavy metal efflux pump
MWIVRLALNRPYTFIVVALLIVLMTPFVLMRTPTDIFPAIDIPVISIAWNYSGLSPEQMEDRIVSNYERFMTTAVDNIEHIESQTVAGRSVIKTFFQPGADIRIALSQITSISQAIIRQLPAGISSPLIITYSASDVPILQLGMRGQGLSEQELFDYATNFVRNQMSTVPGAAIPWPYGGKQRQVSVNVDIPALQSKGLSPVDVINAISSQNLALPAGSVKIGPTEYNVEMNGSTNTIAAINDLPIKMVNGATIYVRDVASVSDGFSPQINIVRMDGQRGVLVTIYKTGNASTLDVVKNIYAKLPQIAAGLPPQLVITPLFDQSIFVRAAVQGVVREGLIAACLTALMILLFLGNWRSTLIIAISIPLSVLISIFVLSALHETINIMTLGGLALAVGILVDDATVEIENINRNLAQGKETVRAILDGAQQIAVPALVSTLSICIVFVPMFFLTGVAKFLFVPLAEAVVFAMLASYLLSRTLVPTLAMYLLKGHHGEEYATGNDIFSRTQRGFAHGFERMRERYRGGLDFCLAHAWMFMLLFLLFCVGSAPLGWILGRDFFPSVDAGLIRMHMRARAGQRVEETARESDQVDNLIRRVIPPEDLGNVLDNIGLFNSTINTTYSNSGVIGESDAEILIGLKPGRKSSTRDYIDRLRERTGEEFPGTQFFFQPADIVSQILNFGVPAPIDIQLIGADQRANYQIAQQISKRVQLIPGAVDVHVQQLFAAPTIFLNVDRTRALSVGLSQQDVANSLLLSLSSSFQINPSFWVNPASGIEYNVAVQVPQYKIDSMQTLDNIPISSPATHTPEVLGNLAQLNVNAEPALITHYNNQPMIDVYASAEGRDLGGVDGDIQKVLADFGNKLPRGTELVRRGQVSAMTSSFAGLAAGVGIAVVLVYFLIVVNFQSWLDPFIIITALPGALAGILWTLFLTHTTLSVPSLTGTIMCMGVATANSILMVSFARERMTEGLNSTDAALEAGYVRIRPVLMTAMAMIIGMLPMSLALGEGGEQNAPLGRAVIGGLIVATFATLFFVPCVFSVVHRNQKPGTSLSAAGAADAATSR